MSAPPPDNRSQQRFVSSINIPVGGMGDMGAKQSQQSQPQQEKQTTRPMERVIPIHVEGRDEPVMPKNTGPSFTHQSQPPQSERIFGHRPSQFTQFVGPRQYSAGPEWQHHPGFTQPQQQKFHQQEQPPPQYQQPPPQQQSSHPPQQSKSEEQVPPPQPPKLANNPIDIIQSIQKDVSELMNQVEKFSGLHRDKQYLYLDEMLTRNLIKLDNIDTQGQENIRQARKEAIKCIEKCIAILDAKAAANSSSQKQSETTEVVEESPPSILPQSSEESAAVPESDKMEIEEPKLNESETIVNEIEKPADGGGEQMEIASSSAVETPKESEKNDETKAVEDKQGEEEKVADKK